MRRLLPLALLLAACHFDTSTAASRDGGSVADADPLAPDADPNAPDADPNAPDAALCEDWARAPSQFNPCTDISEVTTVLGLGKTGTYVYDTDLKTLSEPDGTPVPHTNTDIGGATAIVTAQFALGISATLRATGSRPLMIISWSNININGTIDVSSNLLDGAGAGTNPSDCTAHAAVDGISGEHGAGGGGGGGFGSIGGTGGEGGIGRPEQYAGGSGGTVAVTPSFRGGCPGGAGGNGNNLITGGGPGGEGGGAVYLSARTTLAVSGTVNAGGAGGIGGGGNRSAGGGGGSGGLIGLEAATLQLTGIVTANGGGGGGGGNGAESPGEPGLPLDSVALGGPGGEGGNGGNGGFSTVVDGQVGSPGGRGGGAGGGGVGYIFFSANTIEPNTPTAVSPDATTATSISAP